MPHRISSNNADKVIVSTAPTVEPISIVELKRFARIEDETEDVLITALIVAAREWAEGFTRRAFITQTLKLTLEDTPSAIWVEFPRPPLQSITSFTSFDEDDVPVVLAATEFIVSTGRLVGRITLRNGSTWPTDLRVADGIIIEYKAGFGDTEDKVPDTIKLGLMRIVTTQLEHREDTVVGFSVNKIPNDARMMLQRFRVPRL